MGGGTLRGCGPHHAPNGAVPLARKPNYDFEKHRREQNRKAEKEEKLRRKREKAANQRERANSPEEPPGSASPDTPPDQSAVPAE